MTIDKVNLAAAFVSFHDHWNPRIAGDINDFQVKLAKFEGKFDWHHHETEDELFLVVQGRMKMGLRSGDVILSANSGGFDDLDSFRASYTMVEEADEEVGITRREKARAKSPVPPAMSSTWSPSRTLATATV